MKKLLSILAYCCLLGFVNESIVANAEPITRAEYTKAGFSSDEFSLFDDLFKGKEIKREREWNSEHRALFSSSFRPISQNERLYIETIFILSRDGKKMTTLIRTKNINGKYAYRKQQEDAIFPFIFCRPLVDVIDKKDERLDFYYWEMDRNNSILRNIKIKLYNLREGKVIEESLFWQNKTSF